jgi:hypothetical protein
MMCGFRKILYFYRLIFYIIYCQIGQNTREIKVQRLKILFVIIRVNKNIPNVKQKITETQAY